MSTMTQPRTDRMISGLLILMLAATLSLGSGCAWFRKDKSSQSDMGDTMAAPTSTMPTESTGVPQSVEPQGPRPGDLLPFPELKVVYFDYDKHTLRPDQLANMEHNLQYLLANPGDKVLISGHCDERGTPEYNLSLGQKRADEVRNYYVQGGVSRERIATLSMGEEEPVALGHDEGAWSRNRRCEFQRMF